MLFGYTTYFDTPVFLISGFKKKNVDGLVTYEIKRGPFKTDGCTFEEVLRLHSKTMTTTMTCVAQVKRNIYIRSNLNF